ncbi:MAG TPA: catalase, partial [Thiobacillaceae bacterium]
GVLISDNQNSLKAGLRGPTLLEDFVRREKITHFDHERSPERVVHARGSAAHGVFECSEDITDLTRAAPFASIGKQTPVFVRFSTVAGERGSMDTARDTRGFAVKFYTDEGNWDLVGNNIPVFFIQDAMKFPDVIHSVKPEPHHQMPQASSAHDTGWDFISLSPETTHHTRWAMSDRGIPRSYRTMQGFGVNTYRLVNRQNEAVFVKFHWNPTAGTHSLVWDEAVKIGGADPDFHRRDLWEAIESGNYPQWDLQLQVFTEDEAERFSFDVLDPTKLVPEELVPLRTVGRLTLNRNPDNFFAETEQVAFCPANLVPGIDFSNDPLLQGRLFSYLDTQITRLGGPNHHEIPINASVVQVHNNQRDGFHRQAIPRGRASYEPNSLGGGCPFQAGARGFTSFPAMDTPPDKLRGKPEKFADHYSQARLFYRSQTPVEQQHIIGAFRFELGRVQTQAVRERMVASLVNVDAELAAAVAEGLGMPCPEALPRAMDAEVVPEVEFSPSLSLMARPGDGRVAG